MTEAREHSDRDRAAPMPRRLARGSSLLVVALTLASLLPFANRAFHVDDPLFVWAGDHIRHDPLDFYGFEVHWTKGRWWRMHEVTRNPPLTAYFIAAVRALFGESEIALHLAFLLPALLALLGTLRLAQEIDVPPATAALVTLFSPVFLVSATTVMCDVTLLAFWVWSVVWWERGLRTDDHRALLAAAWLAGLAFLAKYFGIALVPLLLAVGLARRRRAGSWMIPLLIPLGVAVGYEAVTRELYGTGLFRDAAGFAVEQRLLDLAHLRGAAGVGLVFVGGSLLGVAFWLPALCSRRIWIPALAATAVFAFSTAGGAAGLQRVVFGAVGVAVLALVVAEARGRPDATTLLLGLWILGTFAFASWLNWVGNARSVLPMAPAVGLLLARRVGETRLWPLVPAAGIALAVTWADYAQADAARRLAREAVASRGGEATGRLWCAAEWGLKYYLMEGGAQPFGGSSQLLVPGDEILAEGPLWRRPGLSQRVARRGRIEARGLRWLATMDASLGAGFYAASYARKRGPLPFAWGETAPRALERIVVTSHTPARTPEVELADALPTPRHLVLISVDTLRADHLGAYGRQPSTTPALDALAAQSERFAHSYATAPLTLPSVASLLTGRYPDEIGVLGNRGVLPGDTRTLAGFLRANGFRTGAVVSNPVLSRASGLDAGFDRYDIDLPDHEARRDRRERIAPRTTDAALAMLDALVGSDARIFLWVHYQDPHGPYTPPAALRQTALARERARPDGGRELPVSQSWRGLSAIPSYQYLPPQRSVAWYRAGYAGEVAYLDAAVARLLAGLDERGLGKTSLVVFTADHGESLGERDYWFAHGEYLDESAVWVPLLIRLPGRGGSVRQEPASLVDVLPTLASLLGLALDPPGSGFDLRHRVRGRSVYFTNGDGGTRRRDGIVQDSYKLVRTRADASGPEAFELVPWPRPDRELPAPGSFRLLSMRRQLEARSDATRAPAERVLSPAEQQTLRALGYAE